MKPKWDSMVTEGSETGSIRSKEKVGTSTINIAQHHVSACRPWYDNVPMVDHQYKTLFRIKIPKHSECAFMRVTWCSITWADHFMQVGQTASVSFGLQRWWRMRRGVDRRSTLTVSHQLDGWITLQCHPAPEATRSRHDGVLPGPAWMGRSSFKGGCRTSVAARRRATVLLCL